MVTPPRDVTDAELAVLQVLWERSSATIRDITKVLYPDDVTTQYSTVKRLLARLQAKGFVERDESERVHVFSPVKGRRDELVARRLEALADTLCDGSISPLLSHLAESERLTEEQQNTLLSLIDELAEPVRGRGKTRKKPKR